jgi:hypothetical protein
MVYRSGPLFLVSTIFITTKAITGSGSYSSAIMAIVPSPEYVLTKNNIKYIKRRYIEPAPISSLYLYGVSITLINGYHTHRTG